MPKVLRNLTGGSVGFVFGVIAGLSLFNPDSNTWLIFGAVGCILGVYSSSSSAFHYWVAPIGAASIGLIGGWIISLWLFGEHIGGLGTMITGGGAVVGWKIGSHEMFRNSNIPRGALMGAIHFGLGYYFAFLAVWKFIIGTELPNMPLLSIGYIFFCVLGGTIGGKIVHRNI